MKRRLLIILSCCLCLTACGASSSDYSMSESASVDSFSNSMSVGLSSKDSINYSNDMTEEVAYQEDYVDESYSSDNANELDETAQDAILNKDMLVYRGDVTITTKDYETTIDGLQELYDKYDCIIEDCREYSNNSYSYYDDEESFMNYRATVRVPSKDYENMMNGITDIGTVSDKSSNVENMNNEYSDVTTALEIYRAREQRYLKMLQNCEDDEEAIVIEDKLTDLQIQVAQYESRKRLIETDVAYSYITVNINEVKEYSAQIKHTDGFFTRLWKEVANSALTFVTFLEDVLFFIINIAPYVIFFGIIFLILRKTKLGSKFPKVRIKRRKKETSEDNSENKE